MLFPPQKKESFWTPLKNYGVWRVLSILIEYLAFLTMQAIHAERLPERLVNLPDIAPQPKRKRQFALNRLFLA